MPSAAENEVHKLKATFFNNVAVALFATGIVLPVFSVFSLTDAELQGFFESLSTHEGDRSGRRSYRFFCEPVRDGLPRAPIGPTPSHTDRRR
jgi:hypothetical protein